MAKVTVRYHALLREMTGRDFELLEFPERVLSGCEVLARLTKQYGGFEKLAVSLQVAVNEEIVPLNSSIHDGDTVDLLPPFGGG